MGFLAKLTGKNTARLNAASAKREACKSKYRSVQVNAVGSDCCAAVKAIAGKRFLSDEVPMLPLDGCDMIDCGCTYELHDDRRAEVRRASDLTYDIASQLCTDNKRSSLSSGRRSDD